MLGPGTNKFWWTLPNINSLGNYKFMDLQQRKSVCIKMIQNICNEIIVQGVQIRKITAHTWGTVCPTNFKGKFQYETVKTNWKYCPCQSSYHWNANLIFPLQLECGKHPSSWRNIFLLVPKETSSTIHTFIWKFQYIWLWKRIYWVH